MPALELVAEPAEPAKLRAFDPAHLAGDALLARGQNVAQLELREVAGRGDEQHRVSKYEIRVLILRHPGK